MEPGQFIPSLTVVTSPSGEPTAFKWVVAVIRGKCITELSNLIQPPGMMWEWLLNDLLQFLFIGRKSLVRRYGHPAPRHSLRRASPTDRNQFEGAFLSWKCSRSGLVMSSTSSVDFSQTIGSFQQPAPLAGDQRAAKPPMEDMSDTLSLGVEPWAVADIQLAGIRPR